jgi:hypothetical protein
MKKRGKRSTVTPSAMKRSPGTNGMLFLPFETITKDDPSGVS